MLEEVDKYEARISLDKNNYKKISLQTNLFIRNRVYYNEDRIHCRKFRINDTVKITPLRFKFKRLEIKIF